ncbi:hypothetical protein BZG36_01516 [Bifiguratus adelaidae]|uniref:Ricin B lectin domain-containing protein n=1 Tax=Bifiguratus adelaidae TaxID=1938954 RepID=A0A261Y4W9_9FUNG|nr:hypothetical protein BZG36_01516 [Bifiguratus adelaidae]
MSFPEGFPDGFFFIKSLYNGHVVDVGGGSKKSGASVHLWKKKDTDYANQAWCHHDGYLINRNSGLVLDVSGEELALNRPLIQYMKKSRSEAENQRFGYKDGYIYCLANPDMVLDVKGEKFEPGGKLILYPKKPMTEGEVENQLWVFEHART